MDEALVQLMPVCNKFISLAYTCNYILLEYVTSQQGHSTVGHPTIKYFIRVFTCSFDVVESIFLCVSRRKAFTPFFIFT